MSQSDAITADIEALKRLRGHRADRVTRQLHTAQTAQRALTVRIEQACQDVEQARVDEARQRKALLNRYQGQVLSPRTLAGWSEEERAVSAATARQEGTLQALFEQRQRKEQELQQIRQNASQCLRQVEKLREVAVLLAGETL
ncbi:type III secretion protein [Pseudomonas sp.]|uniref:type III secretion protein n=1 Tax=Pseudomonas sp. TaxID=306 RepID=UPI00262C77FA|nr:type III secretion protein [Pseudomonas sp.]